METILACPICASSQFTDYLKVKDHTTSNETFQLAKCDNCHFIFTNPRPTQAEIGKYYQSDKYISHTGSGKSIFDKIYLLARNFTLRWKLRVLQSYQRPAKILDYGCGTGEFLAYCQTHGWDVTGVEPSATAREKASKLLGKPVSQAINTQEKFEAITLWHVLEHIHDLEQSLQNLSSRLKENGTIFIAVPNFESLDSQIYKSFWAGYDVPRHLWHFSKDTMALLFDKCGLKIVETKPMKLDSFYVSLLSEEYKNPKQPKLTTGLSAFVNGVKSNLAAKKDNNYSSLVYIGKHA